MAAPQPPPQQHWQPPQAPPAQPSEIKHLTWEHYCEAEWLLLQASMNPPSTRCPNQLRVLDVRGANLCHLWCHHAFQYAAQFPPLYSLYAHAQQCLNGICTEAPHNLYAITFPDGTAVNAAVVDHLMAHPTPPPPYLQWRIQWPQRTAAVFNPRLYQLEISIQMLTSAILWCIRTIEQTPDPNIDLYRNEALLYWIIQASYTVLSRIDWMHCIIQDRNSVPFYLFPSWII